MRYTVRGVLSVDTVEEGLTQFVEHLVEHDVDQLTFLSIYYTPYCRGRKVEFRSGNGEVIDHIEVQPVATRLYTGGTITVQRDLKSASDPDDRGMKDYARLVSEIMEKWALDHREMAQLLESHEIRIKRLLAFQLPYLMEREKTRLMLILDIDILFVAFDQPGPINQWLRTDQAMRAYPEPSPLEQLLRNGMKALERMRDAFVAQLGRDSRGVPSRLGPHFDAILDDDRNV